MPGNDNPEMYSAGQNHKLTVQLTPRGEGLLFLLARLERMEQEAIKLTRWQDDLRSMGKLAAAGALAVRIEELERVLLNYG